MKAIIWGSRGSLPAPVRPDVITSKITTALKAAANHTFGSDEDIMQFIETQLPFSVKGTYGANTSCVELRDEEAYVLFDAGTGLRDFGNHILREASAPCHFHIFISHLHWDHIQGLPFFVPAYIKENKISLYGCHPDMKAAFLRQQSPPFFPVPFDALQADIDFVRLDAGKQYDIAGYMVHTCEQDHPGTSYGYRLEKKSKSFVYSTDSEHKEDSSEQVEPFLRFIDNADLLIFDAQYSLMEAISTKENWGHSSNMVGVELAVRAKVKHLCMFHSEPTHDDETLDKLLHNTRKYARLHDESYPLEVSLAYDGLEIDI